MFICSDLHIYNKVVICVEDQHHDDIDNIFIISSYVYKCFLYIITTYIPNISLGLVFMYLISPCFNQDLLMFFCQVLKIKREKKMTINYNHFTDQG
jgi:hypothetical protein